MMQRALSKIRTGASKPDQILPYVRSRVMVALGLVSVSKFTLALLYVSDLLRGSDRFHSYLRSNDEDRYLERDVLDYRMRVDALDEGVSRELLAHGVREPLATERYREELARLEAENGPLTVVDIGANIGYFALMYPAQSLTGGDVIAIEPLPSNRSLLDENVRLNGFEDSVETHQCAIGAESKSTTMHVSTHSNWATVGDTKGMPHFVDEIDVQIRTLDSFLRENDVPFDSVDVLRMDVQGYEYEILRGMADLLESGAVDLMFLEVHPWYLEAEYDEFVTALQDAGFELTFAADGRTGVLHDEKSSYSERELYIDRLEDLREIDHTTEIIVRRRQ